MTLRHHHHQSFVPTGFLRTVDMGGVHLKIASSTSQSGVSHERAGTAGFELGPAVHGIVGFAIRSRVVWGVGFYY